jgi:Glyoxalase-like domain
MIRIGSIVLRVDDLQRQTEFWEAAPGYVRREGDSDDFALLRPRDGVGPNLSLDRVRSTLQIPPRIHLDLYAETRPGRSNACSRLVPPRSTGTNDRRTRTTSSSPTRRATASASWTSTTNGRSRTPMADRLTPLLCVECGREHADDARGART